MRSGRDDTSLVLGVTDGRMYELYAGWILAVPGTEVVRLGYRPDNAGALERCGGLVLTGGEDVHPHHYERPDYLRYCDPPDFDRERDVFELKLLERAQKRGMPVLGICRGLQLANVFFGGTLIPDIASWGKFDHAIYPGREERLHQVRIDPASDLYRITGVAEGIVNSIHHQSADLIGKGLVATALSPDGVVEALERREGSPGPFLQLVQWHPERMQDPDSPLVDKVRSAFLEEAIRFRKA